MTEAVSPPPERRLVEAAEAQFRRFGYRRTTIDDITASAGTGKGSLYLHFDSKQDIYMAVVEASLERFVQSASQLLEDSDSVPERLRSLVAVFLLAAPLLLGSWWACCPAAGPSPGCLARSRTQRPWSC